jgi:hypothetical protein
LLEIRSLPGTLEDFGRKLIGEHRLTSFGIPELRGSAPRISQFQNVFQYQTRSSPFSTSKGSSGAAILNVPGYDEATALLYQPNATFPTIPEHPTKEDAKRALQKLTHLVSTFPFQGGTDRAVWLSAVLTGVIRRTLPTAPLHIFNAPVAGSDKGLLADMAATITQAMRLEETEKRLASLLLAGDPVILIDNITAPLRGDFLCSVLTQPFIRPRTLGKSEAHLLPTSVLLMATGNNATVAGDMN